MKRILFCLLMMISLVAHANKASDEAKRLPNAYPDYVMGVTSHVIVWKDGSTIPIESVGPPPASLGGVEDDMGRVRYEEFFRRMYGNSKSDVEKKLVVVYWMPHVFGHRYPLRVTSVNGVDKKLAHVSAELEKLPHSYLKYLRDPVGAYCWRYIANTNRLSTHSFGTSIDLNKRYSNYWQWDLKRAGRRVAENAKLHYHNHIPLRIVKVFEKNGFVWGGSWYHYDTMHFEYRPELA